MFSGAFIASQNHELYDSTQSFQSPLNPFGLSLSLRAGYFPLSFLGAEVEGGFVPQGNERAESVNLFTARGHAVVQLPWRVTPFVLAGGGWLGVSSDTGGDIDPALHWGGGVKVYPVDWMSVRVDARQIWSASQGPGAGNTSHYELLAGISFTLWRAEEEPEPPPVIFVEADPVDDVQPELMEVPATIEAARTMPTPPETPARVVAESLGRVHFAFGSAKLGPSAFPQLDLTAQMLEKHTELVVHIAGHTDAIGSDGFNLRLSRRRARAVVRYLVEAGVDPNRLKVFAYGESAPTATNKTPKGRAANRRCEIRVFDDRGNPLASNVTSE